MAMVKSAGNDTADYRAGMIGHGCVHGAQRTVRQYVERGVRYLGQCIHLFVVDGVCLAAVGNDPIDNDTPWAS